MGRRILTTAVLAAPFIAWLYRVEAALVVMALALGSGSALLAGALEASPEHIHRWLRIGIGVDLTLAAACVAVAVWLVLR